MREGHKKLSVDIPMEYYDTIKEYAETHDSDVSKTVRNILKTFVEGYQQAKKKKGVK